MLFTNGKVFTGRGEDDFVDAFEVTDGRFTWVGNATDREAHVNTAEGASAVDLKGKTVLPGLLDVHTHPAFMSTLSDYVSCLPPAVDSLEGLIEILLTSPQLGAGPGEWILGFGYDESDYPEGRQPDRHDLDKVSATQPVFVRRCDGHSAAVNTVALQLGGITAVTADPPGAAFGREPDGSPNGQLIEKAATDSVFDLIPVAERAASVHQVAGLTRHFMERGIVGCGDLFATLISEPLATFRAAEGDGWLPQVGMYLGWEHLKSDPPKLSDDDKTGRARIVGTKLFMDGAYSNRTAWVHEAYPGTCDHGIRTMEDVDLRSAVEWARANQVQVAVHAMGDRALDHVIELFEGEEPWMGDYPSIRLDHATLFSRERMRRIERAKMSFAVVSHTIFFFAEYRAYANNLSADQFEIAYPIKSFYEHVPAAALSSDAPATAWADDVFVSVQAAVRRRSHTGADIGQHEAITVPQAILLYTARAAQCMPLDGLGQIEAGYEGSFVVLDRDVFSIDPDDIDLVQVDETWVAGEQRFLREDCL